MRKRMKNVQRALLTALVLSLPATPVFAEVVDKIVATVNHEPVTLYELEKAMANLSKEALKKTSGGKKEDNSDLKRMALDHLIDEALINQEVEKLGIQVTDEEVSRAIKSVLERNNLTQAALQKELAAKGTRFEDYREDIRSQLRRFKFISQTMGSKVKVNDEDVEAFYEQNSDKIQGAQEVRISQIVIPLTPTASDEELKRAQGKAGEVYQKAKGGGNFDALMKQYGGEGSGDLGKVSFSGISPQVANELQKLDAGQVTEPIRTQAGFLVVKLLEKPEVGLKGSDEIKARIRDRIYEIKLQEELQKYVDQLKGKSFIEIKS
jgi:peptidyl-prolyl cis-trans isomerase SurA